MERLENVKIVGLKIFGIRKISAIEMQLTEKGIIPVIGKNRQGKSTVLHSMESLFAGKNAVPDDFVKHGSDKGIIEAELSSGDKRYFCERKIKPDGTTTLKIVDKNGFKLKEPQDFMSGLINDLTFDPQPFLMKKTKDKIKFLMDLLKIDFTNEDNQLKALEQERTLVGREIKSLGVPADIEKVERVDIVEKSRLLTEQINANAKSREIIQARYAQEKLRVENHNRLIEARKDQLIEMKEERKSIERQIEELKERLCELEKQIEKGESYDETPIVYSQDVVRIDDIHLYDIQKLEEEIREASETNRRAGEYEAALRKKNEIQKKQEEYNALDDKIKKIRYQKIEKLSNTKMPVDGLDIVVDQEGIKDGVYYAGTHCDNWSDSEAFKISLELCVAMNPGLRAVFIDRGEMFDSDSLKILDAWAKKHDIQAIITIVDDIPEDMEPGVFYIEDGSLVQKDTVEQEKKEEEKPKEDKKVVVEEKPKEKKKEPAAEEDKLYIPSNGNEGLAFEYKYCDQCKKDDVENGVFCQIHTRALSGKSVTQWKYIDGVPTCTMFEKV